MAQDCPWAAQEQGKKGEGVVLHADPRRLDQEASGGLRVEVTNLRRAALQVTSAVRTCADP